jgi:hypothetical protein
MIIQSFIVLVTSLNAGLASSWNDELLFADIDLPLDSTVSIFDPSSSPSSDKVETTLDGNSVEFTAQLESPAVLGTTSVDSSESLSWGLPEIADSPLIDASDPLLWGLSEIVDPPLIDAPDSLLTDLDGSIGATTEDEELLFSSSFNDGLWADLHHADCSSSEDFPAISKSRLRRNDGSPNSCPVAPPTAADDQKMNNEELGPTPDDIGKFLESYPIYREYLGITAGREELNSWCAMLTRGQLPFGACASGSAIISLKSFFFVTSLLPMVDLRPCTPRMTSIMIPLSPNGASIEADFKLFSTGLHISLSIDLFFLQQEIVFLLLRSDIVLRSEFW